MHDMKKYRLGQRFPKGFTLIELLVVLAIISALLTIAVPSYMTHLDRSKEVVLRENLSAIRQAIDQYRADTDTWPASLLVLQEKKYLRRVPIDPITDSDQTWLIIPAPDGTVGVVDIRSGAQGVARDGRAYGEW
jgi:general secretion pathway protein G